MTSHVDADTLALSAEGLLEDEQESTVQQHVAECADCAEQLTELAGVSRILAEVSAPPLPGAVIAGLDDALRTEAEERRNRLSGAEPAEPPAGGTGNVVPFRRRFGPKPWMPLLVAAAAVFVIGGGAAIVSGMLSEETTPNAPQAAQEETSGPDAALAYRPVLVGSGTIYTEKDLTDQAGYVLGSTDPAGALEGPEGDADDSESATLPPTSDIPSAVSSCAHRLGPGDGKRPIMIDLATFRSEQGTGAEDVWVMYYGADPGSESQDSYDVLVVSPECADEEDPRDAILAEATVPAP